MIRVFADSLQKQLREEISNYTDDLAHGRCKSFEEYQKLCGMIQGLFLAERHITDLANRLENDTNE